MVQPIPDNYPQLSPYLCVDGAEAAIAFYSAVFGAKERMRLPGPGGRVGHTELEIGDALVMLSDEYAEMGILGPKAIGGTPVTLSLYVDDVDAVYAKAIELGATATREIQDQFYGDRSGQFVDPFGHRWSVATHVRDVSPEEMERAAAEMAEGG